MAVANSRETSDLFAEIARSLAEQDGLDDTLARIVALTVQHVPGADYAGVSEIKRKREVRTRCSTDDVVDRVDTVQYETGEGPCLDAIWEEEVVRIDDLVGTDRWPAFAPRAVDLGVRSMLGFRLFVESDTSGALNVYSSAANGFTDESVHVGHALAAHAALAWEHQRTLTQLHDAVDGRTAIGMAMGVLMERHTISTDDAFDLLRRTSQRRNQKLRAVAESFLDTGTLDE